MSLDLLTFGEALVEVMRTEIDMPLDRPGTFTGPFPSGAPFIFAVQAARLGAQVAAIGAVGDDAFGICLIDQLRTDGVDLRGIRTLNTYTTGVAFVAYNADGSRDFVFHARHAAAGQLRAEMLEPTLFDGLKCLHLMGSTLSIHAEALEMGNHAVSKAKAAGAKISFDPNLRTQLMPVDVARDSFQQFVNVADVFFPTHDEMTIFTGQVRPEAAAQTIWQRNPKCLIVMKEGPRGCTVFQHGHPPLQVYGFYVEEVDPTGAGDCFDAGFLYQWLNGGSVELAAQWANACGALAVTARGPMAGARPGAEVLSFMRSQKA